MLYAAICKEVIMFYKFRAIVAGIEFRCFITSRV